MLYNQRGREKEQSIKDREKRDIKEQVLNIAGKRVAVVTFRLLYLFFFFFLFFKSWFYYPWLQATKICNNKIIKGLNMYNYEKIDSRICYKKTI